MFHLSSVLESFTWLQFCHACQETLPSELYCLTRLSKLRCSDFPIWLNLLLYLTSTNLATLQSQLQDDRSLHWLQIYSLAQVQQHKYLHRS
ncbi:hypothetical protein EJ08DRAFT_40706 [Tothia fuscella]|uniref:Uncharacterized protein n=1 Tax=Tothia fuscella TaxID=1048955 RepID=A0A9P4NZA0_9PEZI|nr:hypothetical protein EJ08DRAFT_40706 [Tothia fuscella]